MRPARALLTAALLLTALPLQVVVLARLPLPGAPPDVLLVVVVGLALAGGPLAGAVTGFAAGLLLDLAPPADHALGRVALAFALVGYLAGLLRSDVARSALVPLFVVALASLVSLAAYVAVGVVLADPRLDWPAVARSIPSLVLYDVVLAPFVVPLVLALARRTEPPGPSVA